MDNNYLIRITKDAIEKTYAFHGKMAIESMVDIIKEEIFDYLNTKSEEYFVELRQKVTEEILKRKMENASKMENR